jgi:hypothetical protein
MATPLAQKIFGIASAIVSLIVVAIGIFIPILFGEITSLRTSLDGATAIFVAQASRIDTAFTQINPIGADVAATKVEIGHLKGEVGEIKLNIKQLQEDFKMGVKQLQEDIQKIKNAVHADSGGGSSNPNLIPGANPTSSLGSVGGTFKTSAGYVAIVKLDGFFEYQLGLVPNKDFVMVENNGQITIVPFTNESTEALDQSRDTIGITRTKLENGSLAFTSPVK